MTPPKQTFPLLLGLSRAHSDIHVIKVTAGTELISEYSNLFCKVFKTPSHSIPQLPCLHLLMLIYMEQPTLHPLLMLLVHALQF